MASLKHVHTLVQYKARPGWWRCADPECTYVCDKELALNKKIMCSQGCGTEMILTREDMRRREPRCINCSETKKAKAFKIGTSIMDRLLPREGEDE